MPAAMAGIVRNLTLHPRRRDRILQDRLNDPGQFPHGIYLHHRLPKILRMTVSTILMTIPVMSGKYREILLPLMVKSPGSFPRKGILSPAAMIIPINMINPPVNISIFPNWVNKFNHPDFFDD